MADDSESEAVTIHVVLFVHNPSANLSHLLETKLLRYFFFHFKGLSINMLVQITEIK